MGGEWICLGVVDLLGIISFFLLSLVVRKLVVDLWAGSGRVTVWRDVHRLVLQLVAAKVVDVEMEESGERPGMVPLRIPSTSLGQTLRRPRRVLVLEPAGARAPSSGSTRPRAHGRGSSSSHHRLLPLLLTRKFI